MLITGVGGFIGRELASTMSCEYEVIGLYRENKPHEAKFKTLKSDITSVELPEVESADILVHLAAMSDPRKCESERELARKINLLGTRNMLELAKKTGVKSFIYASTGGVYGYRDEPLKEDMKPKPFDTYTKTKHMGEELCEPYSEYFSVTILRYFFPYGPTSPKTQLIPRLMESIKTGKLIYLNASSRPRVNPIHISDAVDCTINACERSGRLKIFNVAGREIVNIEELSMKIANTLGSRPVFEHTGKEVKDLVADTSRAERALGLKHTVSLEEGLKRCCHG